MPKYEVLCKVIQFNEVYGKKGETIELPEHIGEAFVKDKRLKKVETKKESASSK